MEKNSWDVLIAGGGAAGLSAALLLGRAQLRVLVVDDGQPRNRFAAHMHGVLGHEGVPPAELLRRGRAEAADYGVSFADASIERVEDGDDTLTIRLTDGSTPVARALIVATGLADDLPAIPGLAERWGTTVLHCPYCHGWEVRGRRLGVLTTSPLSLHQAELIRQWSTEVTVFTEGLGTVAPETAPRLHARGIVLVDGPVAEVIGEGSAIAAVRMRDGREIPVDALFTMGAARPRDGFLSGLGLERASTPFGSFLAVDAAGATSHDRIWAIGNVVNPGANVPMAMGAGAMAAGVVNAALVSEDFDAATTAASPDIAPADFWEEHYTTRAQVWSGRVNRVLADVAAELPPGTALDLGCGEGSDVLWLAQRGWEATGIDISPTAIGRAEEAARAAHASGAHFVRADLAALPEGSFDLVTASFLHSPVDLPRERILREAAARVAPQGHLLITSHAGIPPWSTMAHADAPRFPTVAEEQESLGLDPARWEIRIAETRSRETTGPDGEPAMLDDVVLLARRR